jgi:hypothetical protein
MRFVLVHGAFVGGWIWGPLAERLEALGHGVEALDLPGSGDDATPAEEGAARPQSAARADRVAPAPGATRQPPTSPAERRFSGSTGWALLGNSAQ